MKNIIREMLTNVGLKKRLEGTTWEEFLKSPVRKLYAGTITRPEQFQGYFGLNPFMVGKNHIPHNVANPMPIPENSVEVYQSEDVFEHLPYELLVDVFNDIYRVLRPKGLFRLSLPDYRFDVYYNRSLKNSTREIYFDPGGGGEFKGNEVINGGHIWFPTIEKVSKLIKSSAFKNSSINFLHYNDEKGSHTSPIDYSLGFIVLTPDHDPRAQEPYRAMSIVVDIRK